MKVELSRKEIELINQALIAWANEPMSDGFSTAIFGAVLSGPQSDSEKADFRRNTICEMETIKNKCKERERAAVLLRAKLIQAENASTEHEEPITATPPRPDVGQL